MSSERRIETSITRDEDALTSYALTGDVSALERVVLAFRNCFFNSASLSSGG